MRRFLPAAAAVLCIGLGFLLQWKAQEIRGKAQGYRDAVTLLLQEPRDWRQAKRELTAAGEGRGATAGEEMDLTLWGETEGQRFTGAHGRSAQVNLITFVGSTRLLFPWGGVLQDRDRQGCLLDEKAAEELFGSHKVLGESVYREGDRWIVRDVLPGKEGLVLLPAGEETGEILLDHVTARLGGRERQSGTQQLLQKGFYGTPLRMDFYEGLSWLQELVPGKWADFEGWSVNLESKGREWQTLARAKKCAPQQIQRGLYRQEHWYEGLSALFLLGFLLLLFSVLPRTGFGKKRAEVSGERDLTFCGKGRIINKKFRR